MKNNKKRTRQAKQPLPFEVWALVGGGFTIALGYGVVAPVLPQFAKEFGVSNLQATAVISVFAMMRLVFAPVAGLIVTKLGERTTYVSGILIVAVATGAAVVVGEYWQLLGSRAIAGIGSTMFTIAATALMIKVMPPAERGRVAGINSAGFLLGNLIGPVIGALVASYGIRAPFVVYFIALVVAAGVVSYSLRNSKHVGPAGKTAGEQPKTFSEALKIKQYRGVLASTFAFGWAAFGVRVSAVPLFVSTVFAGGATKAGWALAAYAGANAAFVLPAGRWNDKIGRKPLLVLGFLLSSVAFLVLPFSQNMALVIAAMMLAGAGAAFANPAQQAAIADVVGKRGGGTVVAATQMTSDFGAILGPLIAGLLIDEAGFESAFLITAAVLAAAMVVWIILPDSRSISAEPITSQVEVVSATEPTTTGAIPVVLLNEFDSSDDAGSSDEGKP